MLARFDLRSDWPNGHRPMQIFTGLPGMVIQSTCACDAKIRPVPTVEFPPACPCGASARVGRLRWASSGRWACRPYGRINLIFGPAETVIVWPAGWKSPSTMNGAARWDSITILLGNAE